MSDFMEKTILHCWACGEKLNNFEEGKWNNLVEFWGGRMGDRKPLCVTCWHKQLEEKARLVNVSRDKAHKPDNLLDAKRVGIVA